MMRLSVARQYPFNRKAESKEPGDTGVDGAPSQADAPDDNLIGATRTRSWQLHRAHECHGRRLDGVNSRSSARHWLATFMRDPVAMAMLRKALLVDGLSLHLANLRDQDVIEQASHLLTSGRWHVCEPIIQLFPVTASTLESVDTRPVIRAPRQAAPFIPGPEIPDQATLLGNADQDAIAGALKDAARNGIPVCEECTR